MRESSLLYGLVDDFFPLQQTAATMPPPAPATATPAMMAPVWLLVAGPTLVLAFAPVAAATQPPRPICSNFFTSINCEAPATGFTEGTGVPVIWMRFPTSPARASPRTSTV